jgi:SEC-C motif domain protein
VAERDCPCARRDATGRVLPEVRCCGLYLRAVDPLPAPDAQALMRSRYTAYVQENGPYLLATWHASTRPSRIRFDAGARWLGLEVRSHRVVDARHQEFEFVARQRTPQGRALRMHERSRFVLEEGRWYYVDGDWLGKDADEV